MILLFDQAAYETSSSCRRDRTTLSILAAAASGSSCSHTRTEIQPCACSRLSVSRSRWTFASSLVRQNVAFLLGQLAC